MAQEKQNCVGVIAVKMRGDIDIIREKESLLGNCNREKQKKNFFWCIDFEISLS